jgi:hypothetical protein
MPVYPDRDTLRLRRPYWRTPAEAVALTARELARRPAATRWDVSLGPAGRALVSFGERYPSVAERFHPAVLWSIAHGHAHPGKPGRHPCAWCMARAYRKRQPKLPALRVDPLGRLALGDPCPEECQAALGWRPPAPPRPKPKAKHRAARPGSGANRTAAPRALTAAARSSTGQLGPAGPAPAGVGRAGLTAAAGPSRAQQDYNLARARAMKLPRGSYEHLTGGRS